MFKKFSRHKEKTFIEADARILLALVWSLKPSDLSVLLACLQSPPDSQIGTSQGSCNDKFWSWLEEKGLAESISLSVSLPEEDLAKLSQLKSFQLTTSGRQIISSNIHHAINSGSPPPASVVSLECIGLLQQYVEEKNKEAQRKLAILYSDGKGVERNLDKAFQLYLLSAEQGDPISANNLGIMYAEGDGVHKNLDEAVKWFRKSALLGGIGAMDNLGEMYGKGIGVPVDYTEAFKWFRQAGELGHGPAQCKVGDFYSKGIGMQSDILQAYIWYKLGLQSGIDVRTKCDAMKSQITIDQIAEGDRVVSQWKPKRIESMGSE